MFRSVIWRAMRLIIVLVIVPISALAQAKDIWYYQNPGDDFYFDGFETAAILQSDDTIAVLAFPDGATTMNAHIGFYSDGFVSSLKSSLIDSDGTVHAVIVGGDHLKRGGLNENGFITYHYKLNESDVPLFQHASIWRIETATQSISYSLKGSRSALDQVMTARQNNQSTNDEDGFKAFMVSDCDNYAAHPNDENSDVAGVDWDDLNGEEAVTSCELAVELNRDNARMHYQLGRAYDKAGNPESLTELKKAAIDMRYPIAFNHLGMLYWDGDYTAQDSSNARDLFEQGMELGNISSKYNFARILIKEGDGGQDLGYGKAVLKSSADAGHVLSQRAYGQYLANGTFGTKEPKAAIKYLTRAANSGDATAAYDLAQLYISDEGVNANPALYLQYLKLAARGGHAKAKEELSLD